MSEEPVDVNLDFGRRKNAVIPDSPADAFGLFIDEGNVFDIRTNTRKLDKFIPENPADALENSFEADDFIPSSRITSSKITKRFFGY